MFNLALFNHPSTTITDQVDWMKSLFRQNGVDLTVSSHLVSGRHNILIEGFTESECEAIEQFCRSTNQQVSIILTEHIDLNQGLRVNFLPISEYMRYQYYLGDAIQRFYGLCRLMPFAYSFLLLGELPDKNAVHSIFPSIPVVSFPYPGIDHDLIKTKNHDSPRYDLCFLGTETPYRSRILTTLKSSLKEKLLIGTGFSAQEKCEILQNSRFNLNIPQNADWPVISPMRVVSSLENGTKTIHLSSHQSSILEKVTIQAESEEEVCAILEKQTSDAGEFVNLYNAIYAKPLGSSFYNWAETAKLIG